MVLGLGLRLGLRVWIRVGVEFRVRVRGGVGVHADAVDPVGGGELVWNRDGLDVRQAGEARQLWRRAGVEVVVEVDGGRSWVGHTDLDEIG